MQVNKIISFLRNIKVGQSSYIDVQLTNERVDLLSAEQLQSFMLNVTMDDDYKEVFKQQQVFLADTKARMQIPLLNKPGMYNLTISVANGQFMRTINRSLKVHPLNPILAKPHNLVEIADDLARPELEIEVVLVSKKAASSEPSELASSGRTNMVSQLQTKATF
jgi:hypothetical protein|tara:strand:+ start:315 stop:806 length:492 start_codon:yes stop_codon:yes gene_type:complete